MAKKDIIIDSTNQTLEDEINKDEDGVIVNLSDIKKEKSALIDVYNELDQLTLDELDARLEEIKIEIKRHIDILTEIETRRNKRFSDKREKEIEEKQRVTKDHYVENKVEIVKEADEPSIPLVDILKIFGLVAIAGLLIAIIIILGQK